MIANLDFEQVKSGFGLLIAEARVVALGLGPDALFQTLLRNLIGRFLLLYRDAGLPQPGFQFLFVEFREHLAFFHRVAFFDRHAQALPYAFGDDLDAVFRRDARCGLEIGGNVPPLREFGLNGDQDVFRLLCLGLRTSGVRGLALDLVVTSRHCHNNHGQDKKTWPVTHVPSTTRARLEPYSEKGCWSPFRSSIHTTTPAHRAFTPCPQRRRGNKCCLLYNLPLGLPFITISFALPPTRPSQHDAQAIESQTTSILPPEPRICEIHLPFLAGRPDNANILLTRRYETGIMLACEGMPARIGMGKCRPGNTPLVSGVGNEESFTCLQSGGLRP